MLLSWLRNPASWDEVMGGFGSYTFRGTAAIPDQRFSRSSSARQRRACIAERSEVVLGRAKAARFEITPTAASDPTRKKSRRVVGLFQSNRPDLDETSRDALNDNSRSFRARDAMAKPPTSRRQMLLSGERRGGVREEIGRASCRERVVSRVVTV